MEVSVSTNNVNTFSVSELDYVRETIENMNKFNQIEVLRIMNKHNEVTLNENKYGVHINLSELKNEIIEELNTYIKYVNTQEVTLLQSEKQKESFKNIYFTKDNKDKDIKNSK
jgi:ABC-type proline/glycine betaine transport system ATPase subunit